MIFAFALPAQTPIQHTVVLTWIGNGTPATINGYHVYRILQGDPAGFVKISDATHPVVTAPCVPLVTGQTCYTLTDATVVTGKTYGYKVTAYDLVSNTESVATPEIDVAIVTIAVVGPPSNLKVQVIQ